MARQKKPKPGNGDEGQNGNNGSPAPKIDLTQYTSQPHPATCIANAVEEAIEEYRQETDDGYLDRQRERAAAVAAYEEFTRLLSERVAAYLPAAGVTDCERWQAVATIAIELAEDLDYEGFKPVEQPFATALDLSRAMEVSFARHLDETFDAVRSLLGKNAPDNPDLESASPELYAKKMKLLMRRLESAIAGDHPDEKQIAAAERLMLKRLEVADNIFGMIIRAIRRAERPRKNHADIVAEISAREVKIPLDSNFRGAMSLLGKTGLGLVLKSSQGYRLAG